MANYLVQSGDDLSKIAAKNGMTLQQLLALNPQFQSNPNLIKPGQNVNIGGSSNLNLSAVPGGSGMGIPNPALNVAHTTPQTNLPPSSITSAVGGGGGGSWGTTPAISSSTTGASSKSTISGGRTGSASKISGVGSSGSNASGYSSLTPGNMQKALLGAVSDVATSASITGKPPVSWAEALALAAKDPNIVARYSDALNLDKESFQQAIEQYQTTYSTQNQLQQTQFENDRRALAANSAAAGQAYSGFRGRAQKELAQNQSGIVTSSRSQLKKNLNDLTSAFEARYGTNRTTPASISFTDPYASSNITLSGQSRSQSPVSNAVTGQLAGGITGTEAPEKQNAITNSALNSYNTALFPSI